MNRMKGKNLTDRTLNVSRNLVWGVLNRSMTSLLPFLTRTVLIYRLGLSYAGLSGLFSSVLMMLNLVELGIGNALVFSMYKPMAEQDEDKVCALLSFYRKSYRIIGTVILLVGLVLFPFIRFLVKGEVPADINLKLLFSIYLLDDVLGYYLFAYKQSLFMADQRADCLSKINTAIQCLTSVLKIAVLWWTENYYAYILILPISTFISNMVIAVLSRKCYPQYICKGRIEAAEQKKLKKNGIRVDLAKDWRDCKRCSGYHRDICFSRTGYSGNVSKLFCDYYGNHGRDWYHQRLPVGNCWKLYCFRWGGEKS